MRSKNNIEVYLLDANDSLEYIVPLCIHGVATRGMVAPYLYRILAKSESFDLSFHHIL